MPEFIIEPIHGRIAISVAPKIGCVSLCMWLWEVGTGIPFRNGCIFTAFRPYTVKMGHRLPPMVEATVAIHRDGGSRLRAIYDHRIRREKEAPDQGLDHFARYLPEYCSMYPQIGHHCRAQSQWLGSDFSAFTDIIALNRLELLPKLTRDIVGWEPPALPHIHRTADRSPVSEESAFWFERWSAHDTAIGWNGETIHIFDEARRESVGKSPASSHPSAYPTI